MRPMIRRAVRDLPVPDDAVIAEARHSSHDPSAHSCFIDRVGAFHSLERHPPIRPLEWPGRLRIAAFNAERMKDPAAAASLIARAGAHVALLSETDIGMARSGNRHTIRELIGASGAGYIFGVEFVELDLGDPGEISAHATERNRCGFHGNAIVTGLRLEDSHLIPLEEGGLWFPGQGGAQRRIGGRIALAARIADAPRPLWLVSVHLESKTDPADRRRQVQNLLKGLDILARHDACVIGGDFNTKALPRGEGERHLLLDAPETFEPLFADLRQAGFSWDETNVPVPTQRPGPSGKHAPPFGKLDWIVARGVASVNAQIFQALDDWGKAISDHEMIVADMAFNAELPEVS